MRVHYYIIFFNIFESVNWNQIRLNFSSKRYKATSWHQDLQTPYENNLSFYKDNFYTFWTPLTSVNEQSYCLKRTEKKLFNNHYRYNLPVPKIYRNFFSK